MGSPAVPIPPLPAPIHALDLGALGALVRRYRADATQLSSTPMTGGASTRRYFRVALPGGASAVAMFVPDGAKPEEVQKHHPDLMGGAEAPRQRTWPFLEVRDLLESRGVDVPRLYAEDTTTGWLLIEDLGDDTLANFLSRDAAAKTALYTRAVRDLARAQTSLAELPDGSIVSTRAFDEDLLLWEIHHFREFGLEARGVALSEGDRALFDDVGARLARRIAAWPRGFVHRDYQSRNLMVRPSGGLAWLDFQDALLGPRVYDLVALLNDSYQTFDRAFVEARLDDFAEAGGLDAAARAELGRQFDLVTVQRKLKDAGRFVFIDRVKQNPSFLPFVVPTIRKVKSSLERLAPDEPDMARLAAMLHRVLPDEA
jgi:aminoglycoside/choline kinase family phosphotransferase